MSTIAQIQACPGCVAVPVARDIAAKAADGLIFLSLPNITCAGCIAGVERALADLPEVADARVNLTRKRAQVSLVPGASVTAADLAETLTDAGYEAYELDGAMLEGGSGAASALLLRLGVAGFAMMNLMLLSVAIWSGAEAATRDFFHWISALIAIPVVAYAGQPFFRSAARALSGRRLNMDVPISLALLLAVGMSLAEVIQSGEHAYFDAAVSLTFFLLAGRYLEQKARGAARSAAAELSALEVPRAVRLQSDQRESVPVAELAIGDRLLVTPGMPIPTDAIVVSGDSELDRSILTGETRPVAVGPGMDVAAGEVNLTGVLTLKATAAGRDHSLSRLADLVALAEGHRNRYSSLADRAARIYAPGVHLLALAAFIGWLWITGGDVRFALNIAVAVLIITCPCALGLAVPAVVAAASGGLYRKGLLLKHGTALERLAEVDCVVFDKTGTLTEGSLKPEGLDQLPAPVAAVALALAQDTMHPLACAIATQLSGADIHAARVDHTREHPGKGISAIWEGQEVRLGRPEWLDQPAGEGTETVLKIGSDLYRFTFRDQLRDEVPELARSLAAQGIELHILSGDTAVAVQNVAAELAVTDWQAAADPKAKVAYIETLSQRGRRVLVVGDGLNDTGALAAGHVSAAPATGLAAARVAADIVVLGNNLAPLASALQLARRARRRILENFAIAAGYNAIAIPLAVMGYATPLAAALAMSLSSLTVSLNALRVRTT